MFFLLLNQILNVIHIVKRNFICNTHTMENDPHFFLIYYSLRNQQDEESLVVLKTTPCPTSALLSRTEMGVVNNKI